jgi:hypothetical protein
VVRMVRRVGSLRAEKVASRPAEYLTIRLCISLNPVTCQGGDADFLPEGIVPDQWFRKEALPAEQISSADRKSSRNLDSSNGARP